jgi:hypothetical protein
MAAGEQNRTEQEAKPWEEELIAQSTETKSGVANESAEQRKVNARTIF